VWLVIVAANTVVLTVFLWHLSAFVVAAALLAEPAGLVAGPGSAAWWAAKPVYLVLAAAVLVLLVAATARVEARARGTGPDLGTGRAVGAVLLCVAALAGVAASGFAHPLQVSGRALLGVRFSPALAVGLLLLGSLLVLLPHRPGDAPPR
jgi:hypothetical protein